MKEDQRNSNGNFATADRLESESENLSSGRRLPLKGQDLNSYIDVWLIEKEGQFFKSTLNTYRNAISDFLSYWNQQKRPGLDSLFIRQYERELTRFRKLAPATVQRNLSALRSFCSWAVEEGLLLGNPALQVKLPKLSRQYRRDTLSDEETDRLLETVGVVRDLRGLRDHLLVSLAVRVGVREIEMHRADVGDYSRGGKIGLLYLQRKGRKAKDRTVVLVEDLADTMDLYLKLSGKKKATDPLFFSERPDRKGSRLSVRGIQSILTSYLRKAGINRPRVSPHSMRHFAATNALQNGAHLKDVQDMMGHSTIATTENYIHLSRRLSDGAEHRVQVGNRADLSILKNQSNNGDHD